MAGVTEKLMEGVMKAKIKITEFTYGEGIMDNENRNDRLVELYTLKSYGTKVEKR